MRKTLDTTAGGLYGVELIWFEYNFLFPENISSVFNLFDKVSALSSAVFCILPFFLLGAFQSVHADMHRRTIYIGSLIFGIFLFAEAIMLKNMGSTRFSYILFTLPEAYFLFALIKNINVHLSLQKCKILGKLSLGVYCVHPVVIETLNQIIQNSALLFVFTVIVSNSVCLLGIWIVKRARKVHL